MAITADNVQLAKIMRRYQNAPQNISATPLAAAEQKAAPYLRGEANRNAAIAARSYRTAHGAEQYRARLALKQQELAEYEDQADKATLFALADLFGVTPLAIYKGVQDDRQRQEEWDTLKGLHEDRLSTQKQMARNQVAANERMLSLMRNQTASANERTNRLDPTHREWWDSVAGFSY